MVLRHQSNYLVLLQDQYDLLKDAVEGFYAGREAKANDIAVRIRTLVHHTGDEPRDSRSLLSFVNPNYLDLDIYHKPPSSTAIWSISQPIRLSGDGKSGFIRDDFSSPNYVLVPLKRWWTEQYLIIGSMRSSKKQLVLDVANKDGGAHVDNEVPARHAMASEPPFLIGLNENVVRPNLARSAVAQAGNELLNYLERHFAQVRT